jgi:hypothetical protein
LAWVHFFVRAQVDTSFLVVDACELASAPGQSVGYLAGV